MDYTIPSSWKEVTLRQYIDLMCIDEKLTSSEKIFQTLSILLGISIRQAKKLSAAEFALIEKSLEWSNSLPVGKFDMRVKIKDREYAIIPNLESLSIGEFIDIEEYASNFNTQVHNLISVLYRPIVEEGEWGYKVEDYDSEKCRGRAEIFLDHFSVEDAQAASVFFSLIASGYLTISPESLVN